MHTVTPFVSPGLTLQGAKLPALGLLAGVRRDAAADARRESAEQNTLPLTDAQREIWLACRFSANASIAYNESAALDLTGALDVHALQRALERLVARHESLRTTFSPAGDAQRIASVAGVDLAMHDVSDAEPPQRGEAANRCVEQYVHGACDLVNGPLFRAALLRLEAQRHRLVLAVHHIICDGWSLSVLQRELGEFYSAEAAGREPALAPAPSLADYVRAEAESRSSPAFKAAEQFWHQQFADEAPTLELPADRMRAAERSYAADFQTHRLPADVAAAVKRICGEHECTVFTGLFAAFNVLLHRLTGQDDVVVGVPSATQVMSGYSGLVGHCANLLPVRSRVQDNQTFAEYLADVRTKLSAALEHWRYPFGALIQQLNLPRDPNRQPLAPVVFNSVRHGNAPVFDGLKVEAAAAAKQFVNFDLDFHFASTGDTLALGCHYSAELYDRATIARWFGHFERLLRGIAANPHARVTDLPLLSEAERQQLLIEWNNTALDYDRDACVHLLFEEQVRRQPDAIALVGRDARWTYAELDRRADAIAADLMVRGVGPDSLVGIFLPRSPQLVAAMLGVLKAGGAYVPLDASYPKERLAFIASDTEMKLVLTERSLVSYLPLGDWEAIVLNDSDAQALPASPRSGSPTLATNLAYVIYTSGSTGQPKGVCVSHRGIAALVAWARHQYRPEELGGVLFATSVCFDVSVFESLVPLCLGGKIILAPNILELTSLPAAQDVTLISGVPSAVAELVRANGIPPTVRTVNVAGEPCPQSLVDALYALGHIERVIDAYGPTETTVYSTATVRVPSGHATIGRPLPNEQVYILDRRMQPVPIGVSGELYIGGEKLARGYLNRPKLTRERFVSAPFMPGRRLYRTGDSARFLPGGDIEFLGRLDQQVKVRGYRIELGEIESALMRNSTAQEAVAIVRRDTSGNARLIAYVVLASDATTTPDLLREELAQRLPEYMLPSAIVRVDKLPRTTSGKIDRRALPDPDFAATRVQHVGPRTLTEEVVSGIWREVLGLEPIGVHDNFFALGGHSLLAAQVLVRLQHALSVELTLQQFFATPTIAGLAPAIEVALIEQIKAAADEQSKRERAAPAIAAKEKP